MQEEEVSLPAEKLPKESIDLSAYRTRELAEQIAQATSLPSALRKMFATVGIVLLAFPLIVACVNWLNNTYGIWTWMWTLGYAVIISLILGFALGVYKVLASLLENIESILMISLETTRQIVHDEAQVRDGKARFPNTKECLEHSYHELILPYIQASVKKHFFLLSKPISWLFQSSVKRSLKRALEQSEKAHENSPEPKEDRQFAQLATQVSQDAEQIESTLQKTTAFVQKGTRALRSVSLLFPRIILAIVLILALFPLLWHWV